MFVNKIINLKSESFADTDFKDVPPNELESKYCVNYFKVSYEFCARKKKSRKTQIHSHMSSLLLHSKINKKKKKKKLKTHPSE